LIFTMSCDRGHRDVPTTAPSASELPRAVAGSTACTLAPLAKPAAPKHRAVAIGDLHGDVGGARAALRAAGAIDAGDHWIGGDLVVIQLGDVLDRGDDESQILELLAKLDRDARAAGGAVIELLGNHELMNAAHDFRYVTAGGQRDFDGDRAHELAPGGVWAKRLAQHDVVEIVGDTVLSHAGVAGDWAAKVDEVNLASRCWLDGQSGDPPAALTSDDSPVWTRVWGMGDADCAALDRVLAQLAAKRMVVAHTVQEHGITSACDGKLWRIDVGLAKLYGGPIEVLELGDPPKVLRGAR
jgi:hypothetical protein